MVNTVNSTTSHLLNEIKLNLPDATDEQVQRFLIEVERLKKLQAFFKQYPQEQKDFQKQLERAKKALDYERSYRIAMIGTTGAGKSTLTNGILGRQLVLTKDIGKPATGAALEIFLDVEEEGEEKAYVSYRDESNIRQLIKDFNKRYELNTDGLNGNLDISFSQALNNLEPNVKLNEQARKEFIELRKTLADIVVQYANNSRSSLRDQFFLADSRDVRHLMDLIDENSVLNSENSTGRCIGLLKSVTYHIKPDRNVNGVPTLRLPGNVCLVDLPGLDGTPLHDIIISEGIKEADAVIFILRPPRILGRGDAYLLDRVRKYISLEGSVQSGDRIFLVLNARDSIMCDGMPDNVPRDMRELMDLLVKDYATHFKNRGGDYPYFLTSAWAAYSAQKVIKGEQLEAPVKYEDLKRSAWLKGKSDREVLEASQVPKLVEELTNFARNHRIEGQIRDGKMAIDSIVDLLKSEYETQYSQLTSNRGKFYIQEQEEQKLEKQRKSLEDLVIEFRRSQLERFEDWRKQLEKEAGSICDRTDKVLKEKMPQLWEEAVHSKWARTDVKRVGKPIYEFVLSETQINLWEQLTISVPLLAKQLVSIYTSGLEAYKMVQKISNGCYGYVEVAEVESIIKELIGKNMRHTMTAIGERIALTRMTDPACSFNFLTADGNPDKKQLFESLSRVPRDPNINAAEFNAFIAEVRKQYESFVSGYCVIGLLNLYRYEMIVIEDRLLGYIKDIFYNIRNSDDPVLKSKIRQSLSIDPKWERVELLERKLLALSSQALMSFPLG